MIPRTSDVEHRISDRRGAGCGGKRGGTAFERGNTLFKHVVGRVHNTRIDISALAERKAARRLCGILEYIRGGCVNRHRTRIGRGVRLFLSNMYLQGFKLIILCHMGYLPFVVKCFDPVFPNVPLGDWLLSGTTHSTHTARNGDLRPMPGRLSLQSLCLHAHNLPFNRTQRKSLYYT